MDCGYCGAADWEMPFCGLCANQSKQTESKPMSTTPPGNVHMKLKFNGNMKKIALFSYIMGALDLDFPLAPPHMRRIATEDLGCKECGGFLYRRPTFTPEELKLLAKQINDLKRLDGHLKLRVKKFTKDPKCAEAEELPDEPEEPQTVLVVVGGREVE